MKWLIFLSGYLALVAAFNSVKNRETLKQNQQDQLEESSQFYDERDCAVSRSGPREAKPDEYACLCKQLNAGADDCKATVEEFLLNNPKLKLCKDQPNYYFGDNQQCDYEVNTGSGQPAEKAMQFAMDLYLMADPKNNRENFIISPLSPQILLAQLMNGCSEEARIEMTKALKLNSEEAAILVDALTEATLKNSDLNKLDIASAFFKSIKMNLSTEFEKTRKNSKITLENVDFTNTAEAAHTINEWANLKTRGNIPEVVTEQSLSPDLSMLLLNAIYFKGTWMYKFNASATVKRGEFKVAPGKSMSAHMMSQSNRLRFGEVNFGEYSEMDEGLRWVELPYDGDQLSMILLLPKVNHELDKNVQRMNASHVKDIFRVIRRNHNPIKVHLKLPKFAIKNSISLVEPLKKLGVRKIFEDDSALSKLSKTPAKVGDVKQDAFLSVDENGTTATAVSKVTIIPLSLNAYEDIYFECNQPFMAMIVDKTSEIPLFMAKINQPLKAKNTG